MKNSKLFLILMFVSSWSSLLLLGRKAFKRYWLAGVFMCAFTKVIDTYGRKKKWWVFYKGVAPLSSMDFFNLGPYFVTSLWILKLTYRKFSLYFLSNFILHILFIYLGLKYVSRFRIFTLVKLTKLRYLGIDIIRTLLLFAFQFSKESFTNKINLQFIRIKSSDTKNNTETTKNRV